MTTTTAATVKSIESPRMLAPGEPRNGVAAPVPAVEGIFCWIEDDGISANNKLQAVEIHRPNRDPLSIRARLLGVLQESLHQARRANALPIRCNDCKAPWRVSKHRAATRSQAACAWRSFRAPWRRRKHPNDVPVRRTQDARTGLHKTACASRIAEIGGGQMRTFRICDPSQTPPKPLPHPSQFGSVFITSLESSCTKETKSPCQGMKS